MKHETKTNKRKQRRSSDISESDCLELLEEMTLKFIDSLHIDKTKPKSESFTNKLMIEIMLGFYFKDSVKEERGWNVIRSYKFLLPRFLG